MAAKTEMPKGNAIDAAIPLLKAADTAHQGSVRKWVVVAKFFASAGWKSDNLTGDNRNLQRVADLRATIVQIFPTKAQDFLRLESRDVADLSDNDKAYRTMYQMRIGAYVSLVARHMRGLEGVKLRKPKAKADAGATSGPDFKNDKSAMHGWARQLNALKAGALIVRNDKDQTMTAADATELQNALTVALAIIGKYTG